LLQLLRKTDEKKITAERKWKQTKRPAFERLATLLPKVILHAFLPCLPSLFIVANVPEFVTHYRNTVLPVSHFSSFSHFPSFCSASFCIRANSGWANSVGPFFPFFRLHYTLWISGLTVNKGDLSKSFIHLLVVGTVEDIQHFGVESDDANEGKW